MSDIYTLNFDLANGANQSIGDYKGKVLLLVNTASKCGLTPQFEGLEKLHQQYAEQGLVIIGFPCNQFRHQDPGTINEITEFCQLNYGVSFCMAEKVDVNGENTHPLFQYLKSQASGIFGSKNIKWNFTKFLVNREGRVVKRFAPATKPSVIEQSISALL